MIKTGTSHFRAMKISSMLLVLLIPLFLFTIAPIVGEKREIILGGILYVSDDDWTIWLNGKRVTPKALPKEVIDLKVYDAHIEVKWFDDWTNQIFPIRLKTHQRFNIDTRIFLPG